MYFAPRNCFLSLFCELQTWKWNFQATFLQLYYVVIYLVDCLKLEKSCLEFHFHFLQFKKKAQKAIFWSIIHFFQKRSLLHLQTYLSVFQTCWDTLYMLIPQIPWNSDVHRNSNTWKNCSKIDNFCFNKYESLKKLIFSRRGDRNK